MASKIALIGYTGFVGSTLLSQTEFDLTFNRANIDELDGQSLDLLVCAGAPAAKWIANKEPEEDIANVRTLMGHLETVQAERLLLVSTVDVYRVPIDVDETTPIDRDATDPYGRHRYDLEVFVRERFPHAVILRLPGLFGKGLKKNFIYDLLNGNALDFTHRDSVLQWYDMSRLWDDASKCLAAGTPLVNFAVEPVSCQAIANQAFGIDFQNVTERPPVNYDMHTVHADLFGQTGPYMMDAVEVLDRISKYVAGEKASQE